MKLIAALVLLMAIASAVDLPSNITGTVIQEFDNSSLCINTTDGLMNVILAYPVSLPNREMQFDVLGKDILGRVVVRPIIEGCSACSDSLPDEMYYDYQSRNIRYSGREIAPIRLQEEPVLKFSPTLGSYPQ